MATRYQPIGWDPGIRWNVTGWDYANRGDAFRYDPSADISGNGQAYTINPEFERFAAERGFQPVQWQGPDGNMQWGVLDARGNLIPESAATGQDDQAFWNASLLAGGLVGGAIGGLWGGAGEAAAGGAGAGTAAGAGGGYGSAAGLVAPEAGAAAGLVAPSAAGAGSGAVTVGGAGAGAGAGTAGYSLGGAVAGSGAGAGGLSAAQLAALQTGGGLVSNYMQGQAAQDAAAAQRNAAMAGQQTQLEMFNRVQELLKPYVGAGTAALGQLGGLAGINGADAQRAAIAAIQGGPEFQAMQQQGEERILANASATGGLRGGNTQAALAQFSPALLSQLIGQQFNRLGGITSLGQNAAAGVGNAGISTGQGIAGLQQQAGAATAGGILASGKTNAGYWGAISNGLGLYAGLNGW